MDWDKSLGWTLTDGADLVSEDRCAMPSSFGPGSALGAEKSTGGETPPQQPESVFQSRRKNIALSSEEYRIISLVISGYTNQAIARHFFCSEAVVYRRTVDIIEKLCVANKLELVLFALTHRIVKWFPRNSE